MIANLGDKYTTVLDRIIQRQVEVKANTIFVLTGITPYIGIENYAEYITDLSTFDKDGKVISKIQGSNMPIWSVKFINDTEFVLADNSRMWNGKILSPNELIKVTRRMFAK